MSGRKFVKMSAAATAKLAREQQLKDLVEQFPEISPDVISDVMEGVDDSDQILSFLRELDLEIWNAKEQSTLAVSDSESDLTAVRSDGRNLDYFDGDQSFADFEYNISHISNGLSDVKLRPEPYSVLTSADSSSQSGQSISDASSGALSNQMRVPREAKADHEDQGFLNRDGFGEDTSLHSENSDPALAYVETAFNQQTDGGAGMKITLDSEMATALIMTFGLMHVPIDLNKPDNLEIELNMNTAFNLYQAWRRTQERRVFMAAPDSADEALAKALQDMEHESYADGKLQKMGLREIQDETRALQMVEQESNESGRDVNSILQFQSADSLEQKWADVLLKKHNYADESTLASIPHSPRNVHAKSGSPVPSTSAAQNEDYSSFPSLHRPASAPVMKSLKVVPVTITANSTRHVSRDAPVDYQGHRQEAMELQKEAVKLGARAGAAFMNKNLGGAVAYHYLQKSHEVKKKAKEAHWEAATNILKTRNLGMAGEIDLHGLRMDEVSMALDEFFGLRQPREVKIITGIGNHSRNQTSEVRRSTIVYLNKYKYSFQEGPPNGVFYVDTGKKSRVEPP